MNCCNSTCYFKSRRSLATFLLNIILNVQELWNNCFFCEKVLEEYSICQFRMLYWNDQYDLYENSFNLKFLLRFHHHVHRNLRKLLEINDCHFICELLIGSIFILIKVGPIVKSKNFISPTALKFTKMIKSIQPRTMNLKL